MPPPGAAQLWIDPDPAAVKWRELVHQGQFIQASQITFESPELTAESVDLLHRFGYEFSLDSAAILERIRKSIPDVTQADLDAWVAADAIAHKTIDGQLRFFRREPRNLLAFDQAAKSRVRPQKAPAPDRHGEFSPLVKHLIDVVAASDGNSLTQLLPIRTRLKFTLTVKPNLPAARVGSLLSVWLPFPQNHAAQQNVELIYSSHPPHVIADAPQRTIHFEHRLADPAVATPFVIEFQYTTAARFTRVDPAIAKPLAPNFPVEILAPRPPHIVFTDAVLQVVRDVVGQESNPLLRAKLLFDWVDQNIPWCAEHEYCLLPSLVEKALKARRGDCGVQSMTYITLLRAAGVPARWQSGLVADPFSGGNLHDWLELYVEPWGWFPADVSYGRKTHPDPRVNHFYFGGLDAYRTVINLDFGQPLIPSKPSLRSEPLDFQRGEVELDGKNLYFDSWDYAFTFTHESI